MFSHDMVGKLQGYRLLAKGVQTFMEDRQTIIGKCVYFESDDECVTSSPASW